MTLFPSWRPTFGAFFSALRAAQAVFILGMLVACGSSPNQAPTAVEDRAPIKATTSQQAKTLPPVPLVETKPSAAVAASPTTARPRWVEVNWDDLPAWANDRSLEFWPVFLRSCTRSVAAWAEVCVRAKSAAPQTDAETRQWLQQHLRPYRVQGSDGVASGLITGYFEPIIQAWRQRRADANVPLHRPPADLASRRPYWTRQQLDTDPTAQASLRGREIAYIADPLDALVLHIQGSGRLQMTEPSGDTKLLRLAFAGHNDHPYQSIGRWLIEQGELPAGQASWPAIKAWASLYPHRVNELLWVNPRVVFFNEEPLPDATIGPRGAQGVPLTPGRSIAVDPQAMPYGTPVWLDTTEPLSNTPLRRLVVAQDTGSAIVGPVRADYFWGWGTQAQAQAGRMKQSLRYWTLWPKSAEAPPSLAR